MYLAVPVSDLCSRYGICLFVSKSIYSLAKPKSEKQFTWCYLHCFNIFRLKYKEFSAFFITKLQFTTAFTVKHRLFII